MNKTKKWIHWGFFFAAAVLLTVLLAESLLSGSPLPALPEEGGTEKEEHLWYRFTDSGREEITQYPYLLQKGEGTVLALYCRLPELADGMMLELRNAYQTVHVSVDGKLVYQYDGGRVGNRRPIIGNILCTVPLKAEYSGKTIEVELTGGEGVRPQISGPIRLRTEAEIRLDVMKGNSGVILFSVFMGILMIISFGLNLFSGQRGRRQEYRSFFYLGIFILLALVWVLTDSTLGYLLPVNPAFIFLLSMGCFQLLPVPFLTVIWQVCGWEEGSLTLFRIVFWGNCALQGLIYFLDLASYSRMLLVTHVLMVLTIVYVIGRLIRDVRRKTSGSARHMLISAGIFLLFGLISLAVFSAGILEDNSRLFRWGLLFFVVLLMGENWSKMLKLVREKIQLEAYRRLAYQDTLTGLGNRTAFEERIVILEEKLPRSDLSLAMLDLNGLKKVNDTGGHRAGDQLLQDLAVCLRRAFDGSGVCYRIGGDEFAILFSGTVLADEDFRSRLRKEMELFQKETGRKISVSGGCVSRRAEDPERCPIARMMEQADALMYQSKRAYHSSHGGEEG